jgi:hypothetical protein
MAIQAEGRVTRIFATRGHTYIRLALPSGTVRPKNGYFRLEREHDNYQAIYSLALSCAINGYVLSIRTVRDITKTEHAEVVYAVVDW